MTARYDDEGRVTSLRGPSLSQWRLDWGRQPGVVDVFSEQGERFTVRNTVLDERIITEVRDPFGRTARTFTSPQTGKLLGWEDPRGLSTRLSELENNRWELAVPGGRQWRWEVEPDHQRVITFEGPDAAVWRWRYDEAGRLLQMEDPTGRTVLWERDEDGQILGISQAGALHRYVWDDLGRIISITNARASSVRISWSDDDEIMTLTDGAGNEIRFVRFADGAPREIDNRLGGRWTLGLDLLGRIDHITDPTGREVSIDRDIAGRITAIRDRWFGDLKLQYDISGHLSRLLVPQRGRWALNRDAFGNLIEIVDPEGQSVKMTYDILGNLSSIHGRKQPKVLIKRNTSGWPLEAGESRWRWSIGGVLLGLSRSPLTLSLRRDEAGRLTGASTPERRWWLNIGYDQAGRPILWEGSDGIVEVLSLIHISEPTRPY